MDKHRDLQLILLGYALSRPERDRILGAVQPEQLSEECSELLRAIRDGDAEPVRQWLQERGAVICNGKDAIQAVIDRIVDVAMRAEHEKMLAMLRHAAVSGTRQDLAERLRQWLDRLEKN